MFHGDYINLGKTDFLVSPVGVGTMKLGTENDRNPDRNDLDNCDVYKNNLEMGVNFFDTAEIYGGGKSELWLGKCYKQFQGDIIIATKFMPFPWRLSKGELRSALVNSMKRLGVNRIDLYQIHFPFPPLPIKAWMDALADVVAEGLVKSVGVSNYSVAQTEKAQQLLGSHGIPLASNQVKFSLLHKRPIMSGLVDVCKKLGITIIAYSPLEKGILTGKYTENNPPTDFRSWRYNRRYLKKLDHLINELRFIGKNHGGKTPGQVSLNWLISKGALPIPGAKDKYQAIENAGAMGWHLSIEEVDRLDHLSDEI